MNIPSKPAAIEVEVHGNFVDGREIEAGSGEMLDVRNPATGDVIARIPNSTRDDIDRAMTSPVAGLRTSSISPEPASTSRPSTKLPWISTSTVAGFDGMFMLLSRRR